MANDTRCGLLCVYVSPYPSRGIPGPVAPSPSAQHRHNAPRYRRAAAPANFHNFNRASCVLARAGSRDPDTAVYTHVRNRESYSPGYDNFDPYVRAYILRARGIARIRRATSSSMNGMHKRLIRERKREGIKFGLENDFRRPFTLQRRLIAFYYTLI